MLWWSSVMSPSLLMRANNFNRRQCFHFDHRRFSIVTGPSRSSPSVLRVLGIESSCDDSCASVVDSERRILSNVRLHQNDIHRTFQGIHPYHAINAHQINIPVAIGRALKEASLKLHDVDGIAYTRGPGIAGCLAVGATAAKSLAIAIGKPLIAVHHMQAHALTPLLIQTDGEEKIEFPFLSLLVSGGHTMLVLVNSSSEFKILADTADKPLGLAIDKISRALKVTWPVGNHSPGSALESYVMDAPSDPGSKMIPLPLALRTGPSVFSFCGLQTATIRRLELVSDETWNESSIDERQAIGRSFFEAAFGQVEMKIKHWIHELSSKQDIKVTGLVISGGVGSNQILRTRVKRLLTSIDSHLKLHLPPVSFCTDNAAMIAWTGIDKLQRGKISRVEVPVVAKWSIEDAENEATEIVD